ncbi:MAG: MMPL family transporter [Oscillospiraceae bacterium]|jgi:predicted RND superfamily exporter protein|nr:MMPL family transporter [Oscillospiraceae bacterium]
MRFLSKFIVEKSKIILSVFILLALVSLFLMTRVKVNADSTKYLPTDSGVRIGMDITEREFPPASAVNLMFGGLADEDKSRIASELRDFEHVTLVEYEPDSESHNKDSYTMYTANVDLRGGTPESIAVVSAIEERYAEYDLTASGSAAGNTAIDIVAKITGTAVVILLIILLIVCDSWITPLVLLAPIAVAVLLNMGTNIFLGEVSDITNQIAAILQLCLSMDYSIILLDRYRQEKTALRAAGSADPADTGEKNLRRDAMKTALRGAFAAITGSSVTTIAGMLALVFMSFTIGRDMGIVLAKGVLLSLVCIFTVLPALILIFDALIEKTAKKALHIKTGGLASVSYRLRYAAPVVFVILLVVSFFLKGSVGITYTLSDYDKIGEVFALKNQIVVLYENRDEEALVPLADKWAENTFVDSANSYASTLGLALTATEAAEASGLDPLMVTQLYTLYSLSHSEASGEDGIKIPLFDFMRYLIDEVATNEAYKTFITDEISENLTAAGDELEASKRQFIGETYSRVILNTHFAEETPEVFAFLAELESDLSALSGTSYIIGTSAMAYEMSIDFPPEMNFITILTVIAIFAVVAIAFRSLSVPLILVCVVQCAVFITMGLAYLQGSPIFFLPLLIVQCLLLGATVDYGILLTSCYIEARREMGAREALADALRRSIHTVMTSSLLLVAITGILGATLAVSDRAISEILLTIAKGGVCAAALTTLILPGLLAAFDRFTAGRRAV